MKLSEQWLREWVNPNINTDELVEQLTMAGLEVDGTEPVAGEFTGVVVGEILSIEQHPDADKLRVCQVAGGDEVVQVVCGAPNARAGIKIPFATVGAKLPTEDGKGFKIKKAKLRGVESHGMLCSQVELAMGEDSDGIWELAADAPTGQDIREYLQLNDTIIEVDLTPNRADCLSVAGIARDTGVLNKLAVTEVEVAAVAASIEDTFPVAVSAKADCPRYVGRVIRNVDVSKPSPLWMQEKLRRAGLRSIDAVVDVTNYVLLELGQPLHAFDLNLLNGGINVRLAEQGEKITLLDGQELALRDDTLVIADQQQAVALAGIMGGAATAVSSNTKDIFLESAFFAPVKIAGRARSYGLHTDSSHRFERGVDYQLQAKACERATQLLLDIVGGEAGPIVELSSEADLPKAAELNLRANRIERVLGLTMERAEVKDILTRLGMAVTDTEQGWKVVAPSWRFDMAIEADLLEELARIYGYNRLPVTKIHAELSLRAKPEAQTELQLMRRQLVANGYQEAITYSFIDPKMHELVCPNDAAVALSNPISADMSVMRTSLWPGLLAAMQHNLNRQQSRVRLFEAGLSFIPDGSELPKQEQMLAGAITGRRHPESWLENGETVDFYDLKGDLEGILSLCDPSGSFEFVRGECDGLHPGQTAEIRRNGENVGYIGAIHPQLQKKLGISQAVYLFQVNVAAISRGEVPAFTELSKYPEVRRDLAVIIDREIEAGAVQKAVKAAAGSDLTNLRLFDIYEGKGIDTKRKSLALGLTFQHSSRTLNEDEVNVCVDQVIKALETQFAATLRN
ncbi:phenylalanine--tRNA ligase subunit beta [Dasania sp. GY-MA-18]|uniref:Phenylalanine--tRNA ligase beta subunit n=1 Tax=Dasania phycosphaerae TaxID=2950436 RepID=A0A9J6RKK9_9GAMM|nr:MULTISPECIES: phenylalanine--tRNA ligase subunit beta [Dasania]MCR8922606.1 phenylalanine--tRNA ligase subunit beta [Dasania sp. GY-MA-18]MCZ0865035.1 phenylalanine--tRNA ligase subunit beta [Dasania phycosphaerae]MCZ0868762.1 phenylalanine--tRNA ligase subunit beta [Dasania phycosphaerae]